MSAWEKLAALPREVVLTIVLIAMIVPAIKPFGLPIMVGKMSKDWYNTVDSLPEGSIVLFDIGFGSGGYPTLGPCAVAALHQMFEKHLKIVIMATALEGSMMYPLIMEKVKPEKNYGAEYGKDYVFLGYIAGEQTAMAAVLGDIHTAVKEDYYGTPIEQIPLLQEITGPESFALVAYLTTSGGIAEGWVYQAYSRYKLPVVGGFLSMMTPSLKPYYDAGALKGILDGIKGAADMEYMTHHPGDAMRATDILSATQTIVLIFIVIGNISYWGSRLSKREGEK